MNLHECLRRLWADSRTARSEAIRAIVQADKSEYDTEVVQGLVQALDHNDYEIQEWATVALRQLRGNCGVIDALWKCFRTETCHSARSCALIALGNLGKCLAPDELLALYAERKDHSKDLILESAIRWAGRNDGRAEMLLALQEIQKAEAARVRREPRLEVTVATAILRSARQGLVSGVVTKPWLKEHGSENLLSKLGETRIERLIAEERARRSQPLLSPEFQSSSDDEPLVPGMPLDDVATDQYVQDRLEYQNKRIHEVCSFVKDRQLASEAKRKAKYRCRACGGALGDPTKASRYVQAHHVEPLSEGGSDTADNLLVLCPNCHAKMHAGVIKATRDEHGGIHVISTDRPEPPADRPGGKGEAGALDPAQALCKLIVECARQLDAPNRERVLRDLLAITAKAESPSDGES